MTEQIVVVPYDVRWPVRFAAERDIISEVFAGTAATIEHVGSTAVPGLAAKPVIDILVGSTSLADAEARIDALIARGYHYVPEYERDMPGRRYFRRPSGRPRTHHLHCVVKGGDFWRRHLAFRDYLRAHPETAREYGELKMRLAELHRNDGPGYTEAKTSFVEGVLVAAGRT